MGRPWPSVRCGGDGQAGAADARRRLGDRPTVAPALRAVHPQPSRTDRRLEAGEAFTNRQQQWGLAAAALIGHLQHTAGPGFDVQDLETPRDNILVFHGVGGVGKTPLSRKLEAALAGSGQGPAQWGEPTWPDERIWPVRIDLARSAGASFENLVLTIRAALSPLGRPLPAFDVALRRYWEQQHPAEPPEEYLRRGGLADHFGYPNRTPLPPTLSAAAASHTPGSGAGPSRQRPYPLASGLLGPTNRDLKYSLAG